MHLYSSLSNYKQKKRKLVLHFSHEVPTCPGITTTYETLGHPPAPQREVSCSCKILWSHMFSRRLPVLPAARFTLHTQMVARQMKLLLQAYLYEVG
jgi:hypothetical protein